MEKHTRNEKSRVRATHNDIILNLTDENNDILMVAAPSKQPNLTRS